MKNKIILFILLLCTGISVFSQKTSSKQLEKDLDKMMAAEFPAKGTNGLCGFSCRKR